MPCSSPTTPIKATPSQCTDKIETDLRDGLNAIRWNTVGQAQDDPKRHLDQSFKYQAAWRWLKKCAGVLRVPRPVHEKRDPVKAEQLKPNSFGLVKALPISGQKPIMWFADEARYGLLPNLKRVWFTAIHKEWASKYERSYCYGAIDSAEGLTASLQTPAVNLEWTQAFPGQIKKAISRT